MKIPAIFDLIAWSDKLDQILDLIKIDFKLQFIAEIFNHKLLIDNRNFNCLFYCARFGENLPKVLRYMRLSFQSIDLKLLKDQVFSVEEIDKFGILHNAFRFNTNEVLSNLIGEIAKWAGILGNDLMGNLIFLKGEYNRHLLYFYAHNKNFDTDFLIGVLEFMKFIVDREAFLSKIIFHLDESGKPFLNHFCIHSKNFDLLKIVKWFHAKFGLANLKKLLLIKAVHQNSIMFTLFSNERNSSIQINDLEVFNSLKTDLNLDETFIKNEILQKNQFSENILQLIFFRLENLDEFNGFISNMDKFKISEQDLRKSLHSTFLFSSKIRGDSKNIFRFYQ
jgi:hypothetical protein